MYGCLQLTSLQTSYDAFRRENPGVGYFLVSVEDKSISVHTLKAFEDVCPASGEVRGGGRISGEEGA